MTDERDRSTDSADHRFPQALRAEVNRRLDIDPPLDESSALADLHMRIAAAEGRQQGEGIAGVISRKGRGVAARMFGGGVGVLGRHPLPKIAWYTTAAFVAIVVSVLTGWAVGSRARPWRQTATTALMYTSYATTNGQRATITLPDGSMVALNVASRLEVPVDYVAGNHALRLDGEALFTVRHEGSLFTVNAGGEIVRVLGTSFAVRRYSTDSVTMVAVREGKVAVRTSVLTAGRQIEIGRASTRFGRADTSRFAFAAGVLVLDDCSFPNAIAELDRWFDADIRLGDAELVRRRISISFAPGSVADLVSVLQLMDLRVVREGRRLTLFSR